MIAHGRAKTPTQLSTNSFKNICLLSVITNISSRTSLCGSGVGMGVLVSEQECVSVLVSALALSPNVESQ